MRFLHRAKHWQLFFFLFLFPIVGELITVIHGLTQTVISTSTQEMFGSFKYFPFIVLIPVLTIYAWLYSIGNGLKHKMPKTLELNSTSFRVAFFFSLAYFISSLIFVSFIMFELDSRNASEVLPSILVNTDFSALIFTLVPIHLLAVFCLFHCFYFCAKMLKTVQLNRKVIFSDFAGEFFLLWFSVIGVWILQPKINHFSEQ